MAQQWWRHEHLWPRLNHVLPHANPRQGTCVPWLFHDSNASCPRLRVCLRCRAAMPTCPHVIISHLAFAAGCARSLVSRSSRLTSQLPRLPFGVTTVTALTISHRAHPSAPAPAATSWAGRPCLLMPLPWTRVTRATRSLRSLWVASPASFWVASPAPKEARPVSFAPSCRMRAAAARARALAPALPLPFYLPLSPSSKSTRSCSISHQPLL